MTKVILFCQKCGRRIQEKEVRKMNGLQVGTCCYKPPSFREKVITK